MGFISIKVNSWAESTVPWTATPTGPRWTQGWDRVAHSPAFGARLIQAVGARRGAMRRKRRSRGPHHGLSWSTELRDAADNEFQWWQRNSFDDEAVWVTGACWERYERRRTAARSSLRVELGGGAMRFNRQRSSMAASLRFTLAWRPERWGGKNGGMHSAGDDQDLGTFC
jgi:hypothetical protein